MKARKSPVQARSAASVEAILDATIQVLLAVGKDRLTTTRVATRAGVSVGTLYQYFPNKSSMLQAALARHLDEVASAIERVGAQQKGRKLQEIATALITMFLAAKVRDLRASIALYSVSSDVDGWKIARERGQRAHQAIVAMIVSSSEPIARDPQMVATVLHGSMTGISRRLLEADKPQDQLEPLRAELIFFACSYLQACRSEQPVCKQE